MLLLIENNERIYMTKRQYKIPITLSIIYIVLCVLAFTFCIVKEYFACMFIIMLTLPWSFLVSLTHDIILNPIFNIQFDTIIFDVSYVAWVIVNTFLIFFIYNRIKK